MFPSRQRSADCRHSLKRKVLIRFLHQRLRVIIKQEVTVLLLRLGT